MSSATPPLLEKRGAGVVSTAMAVACQMAGVGILQLPLMLAQTGWVCLAIIVLCAAGTNYTGKLLVRCCYEYELRTRGSYAEIGEAAFGATGRKVAVGFERIQLFLVSSLFLILAGKFLFELTESMGLALTSRSWSLVTAFVGGLPLLLFRTIAELKAVTYAGVAAVFAVAVAVLVQANVESPLPGRSGPTDVFLPEGLVPACSALCLSLSAHAGLPSIELHMRKPSDFPKALNLAYGLVLLLYLPIAGVGYAVFGDKVYSPVLCSLPREGWVQQGAKALVTMHVVLTFPVLLALMVAETEQAFGLEPGTERYLAKRTLFRGATICAAAAVAVTVPYFSDFMSFVGALCVVVVTYVLPSVFYLKLTHLSKREKVLPVLVATLGVLAGAVGVVQAGASLYHKIATGADPNG